MSKYSSNKKDIYYPNSNIPINKKNIKDSDSLQHCESISLKQSYKYFYKILSDKTQFDINYFISIHSYIFNELYDFAGKIRDFDISKAQMPFCKAIYIEKELDKIFQELKEENFLKDHSELSKELLAERLAYYKCELNTIHPFAEGNGRTIRLFLDMIATFNGYDFVFQQMQPDYDTFMQKYIDACKQGVLRNYQPMYELIYENLTQINP